MVLFCGARGLDGLLSFGYFDHCGFALIEGVFCVLLHLCGFLCVYRFGRKKKKKEGVGLVEKERRPNVSTPVGRVRIECMRVGKSYI